MPPSSFEKANCDASKGKLNVLADSKNKTWQKETKPTSFCGPKGDVLRYGPDSETIKMVKDTVSSQHPPHLLLVNLLGVDTWGHGNNWNKYLENIRLTDRYALDLWNTIQSNPILKDKTTLFITNDHGRHLDGIKEGDEVIVGPYSVVSKTLRTGMKVTVVKKEELFEVKK